MFLPDTDTQKSESDQPPDHLTFTPLVRSLPSLSAATPPTPVSPLPAGHHVHAHTIPTTTTLAIIHHTNNTIATLFNSHLSVLSHTHNLPSSQLSTAIHTTCRPYGALNTPMAHIHHTLHTPRKPDSAYTIQPCATPTPARHPCSTRLTIDLHTRFTLPLSNAPFTCSPP